MEPAEQDIFCEIISQIYEPEEFGGWIDYALENEFRMKMGDEGSTLRGNSLITKVITSYCRKLQGKYIKNIVHDVVSLMVNGENLMEVDTK